jgi:predicted dehydrogenase
VPFQDTHDIRFDFALAGGATMDLGCYTLQMLRYFSGATPRVQRAVARLGPPDIDVAMEADFELPGGATARMSCSMEANADLWVSLEARGDGGELSVINPLAPQFGHRLTLRTAAGETEESVPGDTTYAHQLRAFVAAVRGQASMATDAREGVENMKLIDAVYAAAGLRLRGA